MSWLGFLILPELKRLENWEWTGQRNLHFRPSRKFGPTMLGHLLWRREVQQIFFSEQDYKIQKKKRQKLNQKQFSTDLYHLSVSLLVHIYLNYNFLVQFSSTIALLLFEFTAFSWCGLYFIVNLFFYFFLHGRYSLNAIQSSSSIMVKFNFNI